MKHVLPWLVLMGLATGCLPTRRDVTAAVGDDAVDDAAVDDGAAGDATDDGKADGKDTGGDTPAVDVPVLGCKVDADCTGYNDPCHTATCDAASGLCKAMPAADDSPCVGVDDKCAASALCKAGACVKTPASCDDGNPCTVDSCDPATGCSTAAVPVPKTCGPNKDQPCGCDDLNACTVGDVCVDTTCKGTAVVCDDKNDCTTDSCDASGTGCSSTKKVENSVCDDGDAHCTTGDKCISGVCTGTPVTCPPDSNACNISKCIDFLGGCQTAAYDGAACDDGDPCTEKDVCNAIDPANGACAGKPKDCDDKSECTDDACVPGTGCTHTPNTATTCKLGDICAPNGTCNAGTCTPPATACDDGNVCTDDACDPKKGCLHTNNAGKCNDGNACTYSEACSGGVCGGSLDVSTDDGNDCTVDACDPLTGPSWTIKNNGVGCGTGKSCTGGICQPSSPCGDTICAATEKSGTCPADCPISGGQCNVTDAACISTCTTKVCGDAMTACVDGDDGCATMLTCTNACTDATCRAACLLSTSLPGFPTSLQLWLNVQWCQSAQCLGNGWAGKPCVPATPEYATCAPGCESALCLQTSLACELTNGCPAQRTCLGACAADPVCEANCAADPAATAAAKALLLCSMKLCQ